MSNRKAVASNTATFLFTIVLPAIVSPMIAHIPQEIGWPLAGLSVMLGIAIWLHGHAPQWLGIKAMPTLLMLGGFGLYAGGAVWYYVSAKSQPVASELKTDARQLSQQILQFLADRGDAPSPRSGSWDADVALMLQHSSDTMRQYSVRFGARVIAARNALAERGLTDAELEDAYEHPTNPIGIRIVGERLGALAEKLPD